MNTQMWYQGDEDQDPANRRPSETTQESETESGQSEAHRLQANCPVCRAGTVKRRFTNCGLAWLICFPFGLICCFLLSSKQCDKCGYNEGL